MKKDIIDKFGSDYTEAVTKYNNGEYVQFFRNIRPAIESFCKLAIYDIIGDDELANDLICGDKSLSRNPYSGKYLISDEKRRATQGRGLVVLFKLSYFHKHPEVALAKANDVHLKLKRDIELCVDNLTDFYSIASEIGMHSGETAYNSKIQADNCKTAFPAIFDSFSGNAVLGKDTLDFLFETERKTEFNTTGEVEGNGTLEETNKRLQEVEEMVRLLEKDKEALEKTLEEQQKENEEQQKQYEYLLEQKKQVDEELEKDESGEELPITMKPKMEESTSMEWNVEEERLDGDQKDLIEETIDKSMLVAGCAGSGKSVIAVHKAEQIARDGGDVILIAFTKSLTKYMVSGGAILNGYKFYYHYQWKEHGMPSADYIIVDEIQDFTRDEIEEFIDAAKKHYFFFGDTAQSIYKQYGKNTMSIEAISEMTGLDIMWLYNNYRLPRAVAKVTQDYVGVNVEPYREKIYKSEEKELPHFVYVENDSAQLKRILDIIDENSTMMVGILLPSNEQVLSVSSAIKREGKSVELKYEDKQNRGRNRINTLDFTTKNPKVMTYHSAKGLQFDVVVIPMFNGAEDEESKKALYVAMTRTMHKLYIFYSTPSLAIPLSKVPRHLYLDK